MKNPTELNPGRNHFLLPDVKIYYWDYLPVFRWTFPVNSLPYWCCYMNREEGASVIYEGREIMMTPGKVLLIAPNTEIATNLKQPVHHFFIHFLIDSGYVDAGGAVFEISPGDSGRRLLDELEKGMVGQRTLKASFRIYSFLMAVLAELPEDFLRRHLPAEPGDSRIQRVINLLKQQPAANFKNSRLAAIAGMSENNLLKLFRDYAGVSPQFYLRREKTRQACLLLHFSDKTIDEIAAETGFVDRFHFSRVFRKMTGEPPGVFRKRWRQTGIGEEPIIE